MEVAAEVALEPREAVALWADTRRWPSFVEGFARLIEQSGEWPAEGSKVVWDSGPTGRGRVTEKVVERGVSAFCTRVHEERLTGLQTARFEAPSDGAGSVARLTLEYELTSQSPLRGITDVLFVRRALRDALLRTLRRFAVEAQDDAGLR